MRRFVLGTAGHVDHGKTTLVRALTGVDTDRLPEEKRRGITIELGFAPWDLGDGMLVSVIDVPGHRRLVHTMIAGASGMELVLLVVAADEGVMPQTREHVAACELLGLRRAVVAVTKLDKAGEELATMAGDEARELLLAAGLESEVVLCSGRTGEGIERVRDAVRRALLALGPPRKAARARLSVDRVFTVKGAGTVVTGTLVEGRIAVGEPLFVAGQAATSETSARGLHVHDKVTESAEAPCRLAVNLAGLSLEEVHRGDVVSSDPSIVATRSLDVALRVGADVRAGASASLHVGTARTTARIDFVGAQAPDAAPEVTTLARLRLGKPLVAVGGDRFVLRGSDVDGPAGAVLGGGTVLDARPPRVRPRAKRRAVLEALRDGDAERAIRALTAEASPRPFALSGLGARFALDARALEKAADTLSARHELVKVKGPAIMVEAALLGLATRARSLVAEHHMRAPLERGLGLETLRQKLGERAGLEAAEEALRRATSKHPGVTGEPIVVDGDVARLASFGATGPTGAVAGLLGAAMHAITAAALRGVTEHALKEATQAPPKDVRALMAKLVRDGFALHAGELWFSKAAYDELRTRVEEHLAKEKRLTIADFKALSGLGRKQAIPLLEQLDREGVTRREGDDRMPGKVGG